MSRSYGLRKVKERLIVSMIFLSLFAPLCYAQISEKDMQSVEEQEFGIDNGKKVEKKQPEPQTVAPETPPEDYQVGAEAEKVKDIEAEEFRVKFVKSSHSGRVLLLSDPAENRPRPGKVLLLKSGNDDVCAIRVLKNYQGKFAGKVVLPFKDPVAEQEYRALKKLGDKIITMIKEHEKRGKDLDAAKSDEELAKEVSPDDNELDRGIPSPKKKGSKTEKIKDDQPDGPLGPQAETSGKKIPEPLFNKDGTDIDASNIEVSEDDEPQGDLSVQEELPIEPARSAVSVEYGSLHNVDSGSNPTTYSGIGLRYAFNVWRMPFFKRKSFQDMLSFELGAFYYQISGFVQTTDSVTVIPIIATMRYNLMVGENLMFYPYIGVIKNNVSQASGLVSSNAALLSTAGLAAGVGAMLRIGPSWGIRGDFGTDLFGIGAVLKF